MPSCRQSACHWRRAVPRSSASVQATIAAHVLDANLPGDGMGLMAVVAPEHHGGDAQELEFEDRFLALRANGICDTADGQRRRPLDQHDSCLALLFQRIELGFECWSAGTGFHDQEMVS